MAIRILDNTVKKLVVAGGFAALAYMAVRRLLGGGGDWQTPDPVSDIDTLDVAD